MSEKKIQIHEVGTVGERINLLVDHFCRGNKTAFGRAADIQSGVLAGIVGGRGSKPGFEILQKLLTAYPTINPHWLLFGQGQMLQQEAGGVAGTLSLDAQIDASEVRLAQEFVTITAAKLARQKQMMELFDKESMRLTAQKADIAERQAAGRATPEDAAEYQQLNTQWLRLLDEKNELSNSIDFGTTLLSEQQAEYIELINQQLGIQPPDSQS
jgi:hypothetical protein